MDENLQTCASKALCNISNTTSERIQEAIGDNNGIQSIVKLMETFPKHEVIQMACVDCLTNIGQASVNYYRLQQEGVVKKVVNVMVTHGDSVAVQESCIECVGKFGQNVSLRKSILDAKGAGQIAIAMIMFSHDLNLLDHALRALSTLSIGCADGDGTNKNIIIDSGAIDSIVSAMQLHRDDSRIQASAAWTLGDIGLSCLDAALFIGECGGIDVVTRALYVHVDIQNVTKHSCRALEVLSKCTGNHRLMVEIGVIQAVVHVMQNHSDSAAMQASCLRVLSNLAQTNHGIKIKIVGNEALDSISMAMVIHSEDRALQQSACSVLRNVVCEATLDSLLAIGATELMAAASLKFPNECRDSTKEMLAVIGRLRTSR